MLGASASLAVAAHVARLERGVSASDVDQIIGTSKELVECACKVVLEGLGLSYGSGEGLPALSRQALTALGLYTTGLQDRDSLRALAGAISQIPFRVAELRNTDGTGHGRSALSDIFLDNALLIAEAAALWTRCCVKALERILIGFQHLAEVEQGILGGATFRRGELEEVLRSLEIEILQPDFQHRLGLATGRRAASGTFNVASDVLEPAAEGRSAYPEDF